jgi:putative membrane protein
MFDVTFLPTVNATLNAAAACLLVAGFYFIRRKSIARHRVCMVAAFATSVLFLISYLVYHAQVGSKSFPGEGWARTVYLGILLTHTVLAAAVPPLALVTLSRALSRRFDRHRRIARWALPIWLYVSMTGVIVYLMLYHWH